MTPEAFVQKLNQWAQGTMVASHGTRFLSVGDRRAVAQLDFKPALAQLTGLFHAGAIIALADETATAAALWEVNPAGELRPDRFPLTIQISVNLVRNSDQGTLTAEAEIVHQGRTTIVAEVRVSDDRGRLVARMTATLLTPSSPPASPG